ncbi:MAG: hypothetical protein AB7H97_17445 [Pseudobdellovibrionaceae bacterium]
MKCLLVFFLFGISFNALAQDQAAYAPDADLVLTVLSETSEGMYVQNNQSNEVAFVQLARDIVHPRRYVGSFGSFTNCGQVANGTLLCGRSMKVPPTLGYDFAAWNKWREQNWLKSCRKTGTCDIPYNGPDMYDF